MNGNGVLRAALVVLPLLLAGTGATHAEEFLLASKWSYVAKPTVPNQIFAHGQANVFDRATNAQLGGVGFYCGPKSYVDIFVHKPGGAVLLNEYYWGMTTIRNTSLKLNGISMPASVEKGIIYVDINDQIRRALSDAFDLKAGAATKRLGFEVPNFAKFDLVLKLIEPRGYADTAIVTFPQMMSLCDATLRNQKPRGA